jgi:hypothetical protein
MSAHANRESANREAASLVNMLREAIDLPQSATAEDWEPQLEDARKHRAVQIECDVDELDDSDGDVWIMELELEGVAP